MQHDQVLLRLEMLHSKNLATRTESKKKVDIFSLRTINKEIFDENDRVSPSSQCLRVDFDTLTLAYLLPCCHLK